MVYIYALKLENYKYYIGKTNNPNFRLNDHFNAKGSVWTRIHKPIKVRQLIPNCDDYDEDKLTRMYMDKYGIENVRGGSFVQPKLDDETIKFLTKMQHSSQNKCFKCGKDGHFANDCPQINIKENVIKKCSFPPKRSSNGNKTPIMKENNINEIWICDYCCKEFDTLRGASFHQNFHCPVKKKNQTGYVSYDDDDDDDDYQYKKSYKNHHNKCFKCGRKGHYADSCYATTHIKGYYLE